MKFAIFVLCLLAAPASAGPRLEHLSSYTWSDRDPNHGGYSALHLYEGGKRFLAISDRGDFATGELEREEGAIVGLSVAKRGFLKPAPWAKNTTPEGRPHQFNSNSEAVAVTSDGVIWVAFEGFTRLRRFETIDAPAGGVERHPDFLKFQTNSGMEALAVDAKDRLYTLPERSGQWTRPFQVYRLTGKKWERWAKLPRRDRFLPTGADIGPDGRFYLIERRFEVLQGFATRIRRFEMSEDGLFNEEELLKTPFRALGNTEGISVWRDTDGALRLTVVTDDNFSFLQSTQFHEFRLVD